MPNTGLAIQVQQPPQAGLNPILVAWLLQFVKIYNAQIVPAPLHNNSMGTAGELSYDSGYIYICIATNSWKRIAYTAGSW